MNGPPQDPPAGAAPSTRSGGSMTSPDTQLASFVPNFILPTTQEPRSSMTRSHMDDGSSPDPYPRHEFPVSSNDSFQFKSERMQDDFDSVRGSRVPPYTPVSSAAQGFNQEIYQPPSQYLSLNRNSASGSQVPRSGHALNPLAAPHGPSHRLDPFLPAGHLESQLSNASNSDVYSYNNSHLYPPSSFTTRSRDQDRMEGLYPVTTDYGVPGNANARIAGNRDMYATPSQGHGMENLYPLSTPAHGAGSYLAVIGQPTPTLPNPQPRREIRPHDRRFLVRNVPVETEALDLLQFLRNREFTTTIGPNLLELNTRGQWWVAFTDLRQAQECATNIINNHPSWIVEPINENHFRHGSRLSPCGLAMEDQVLVIVYSGPGTNLEAPNIVTAVKLVLELVGPVCAIRETSDDGPKGESRFEMHELVVRYFDAQHAVNALKSLNTIRTETFVLEVLPYNRNPGGHRVRHWTATQEAHRDRRSSHVDPYLSPEDRDRSPPTPDRASSSQAQTIDTIRICQDSDTRTTVMLKNVPNDMSWQNLKEILDLTSAGRYDFMYLRMDFEERQNVGYAFVNFVSARDIIPFFVQRHGQYWPGFPASPAKIAEISYATSQGRAALIEKFRNSPVILDFPQNRPKAFIAVRLARGMDPVGHDATLKLAMGILLLGMLVVVIETRTETLPFNMDGASISKVHPPLALGVKHPFPIQGDCNNESSFFSPEDFLVASSHVQMQMSTT
ncbi:meiosis protein MEI2 [Penicillium angulare]|uniref:Meiosis protein MEI2 n=1 Tax=Penicillium angulare TaxID=116970 RepID=A0A9W9FW87_9EURO|nr:meiosis protein MEI2 [Penicillium angulare]